MLGQHSATKLHLTSFFFFNFFFRHRVSQSFQGRPSYREPLPSASQVAKITVMCPWIPLKPYTVKESSYKCKIIILVTTYSIDIQTDFELVLKYSKVTVKCSKIYFNNACLYYLNDFEPNILFPLVTTEGNLLSKEQGTEKTLVQSSHILPCFDASSHPFFLK